MVTNAALLRPRIRQTPRRRRQSPRKAEVFSELDRFLHSADQAGRVGFILSLDARHRQMVLYHAPGQRQTLRDEAIFRVLNLSIGLTGTRLNGRLRHHRGAPDIFTKGVFVPAFYFNPSLPDDVWIALKNIRVKPDENEVAISFPSAFLVI